MILGVDTKYRLVFSGPEAMGLISGIQPAVTVQIVMQAVNGGSQSVASEPVLFTVPPVAAVTTQPAISEAVLAPLAAISPNGNSNSNGNSNGNGNGSHAVSRLS